MLNVQYSDRKFNSETRKLLENNKKLSPSGRMWILWIKCGLMEKNWKNRNSVTDWNTKLIPTFQDLARPNLLIMADSTFNYPRVNFVSKFGIRKLNANFNFWNNENALIHYENCFSTLHNAFSILAKDIFIPRGFKQLSLSPCSIYMFRAGEPQKRAEGRAWRPFGFVEWKNGHNHATFFFIRISSIKISSR